MTFEDLEQQFREARPSASDLVPTEKTFEVWDALLEYSPGLKIFFQPRKILSLVTAIILIIGLSAVLLSPKNEKTKTSTATIATTTPTEVPLSPNSGFSFGTVRHAVEREIERINGLKSCLDEASYKSLIDKYLAQTKFSNWHIVSDGAAQKDQCAFGKVLPDIQLIQVSYR